MEPASELTPELRICRVRVRKVANCRDLPWRRTYDRMLFGFRVLQQTQVSRVDGRWQRWLERFPTVDALAAAAPSDVLEEWRAWATTVVLCPCIELLRQFLKQVRFSADPKELVKLPGIGPATAAGIRAFAVQPAQCLRN